MCKPNRTIYRDAGTAIVRIAVGMTGHLTTTEQADALAAALLPGIDRNWQRALLSSEIQNAVEDLKSQLPFEID